MQLVGEFSPLCSSLPLHGFVQLVGKITTKLAWARVSAAFLFASADPFVCRRVSKKAVPLTWCKVRMHLLLATGYKVLPCYGRIGATALKSCF